MSYDKITEEDVINPKNWEMNSEDTSLCELIKPCIHDEGSCRECCIRTEDNMELFNEVFKEKSETRVVEEIRIKILLEG